MQSQMVSVGVPLLAAVASCAILLSSTATKLWIVGIAIGVVAAWQQILSPVRRCSFKLTGLFAPCHIASNASICSAQLRDLSTIARVIQQAPTGGNQVSQDALLRRLSALLWSGGEPQLAWACPKDGDWRLELRDMRITFPEVGRFSRQRAVWIAV